MRFRPSLCVLALLGALAQPIAAQAGCRTPSADCVLVGKLHLALSMGFGERSNPIIGNDDIPLYVLPQISYYGERFFLENLEFGFTLYESDAHTFNVVAAPGYDRVFFFSDDLQNIFVSGSTLSLNEPPSTLIEGAPLPEIVEQYPLHNRNTTYLAGPEWLFRFGDFIGQLDLLREVTGEHQGYEVRAAVATPVVQSTSSLVVSAGFTWKSAKLVGYYYGIDDLYEPGAAFNPFVKLGFAHPISERWTFSAHVHHERLDDAIADSPIVGKHRVTTYFAGFVFKVL
jgi:outer membrane protein